MTTAPNPASNANSVPQSMPQPDSAGSSQPAQVTQSAKTANSQADMAESAKMQAEAADPAKTQTENGSQADRKNRRLGRGLASLMGAPIPKVGPLPSWAPARAGHPAGSGTPVGAGVPADPGDSAKKQAEASPAKTQAEIVQAESSAVATPAAPDLIHSQHLMLANLYVHAIEPNPHQPRRTFDEQSIASLAESIKVNGLVQPILVRRRPETVPASGGQAKFQLIAGERRWRAACLAGLESVPAIVKPIEADAMLELALVENLHRQDLDPMERAGAYRKMIRNKGFSQDVLAQRLGESRASVVNYLRLLELPDAVQRMISAGELTFGHAKALLALREHNNQSRLAEVVVEDDWSVREVEKFVAQALASATGEESIRSLLEAVAGMDPGKRANSRLPKPPPPPRPANIVALEEKLTRRLGTRVAIHQGRRPDIGKVTIDFYCLDDFDRILDALGVMAD